MSSFDAAILTVLKHEGGFVDDPADPGGATNYGVSLRWLRTLGDLDGDGYLDGDLDHDGDVDASDIRAMSQSDAENLYRLQWWNRYEYELINDQEVATKIFDMAVNMGAHQAHKIVQRACHAVHRPTPDDGKLGPNSLAAINGSYPNELLPAIRSEAAAFYRLLVVTKPRLAKFKNGWLKRAYS
ncbi:MAG: hypothetical protein OEZ10_11545 [Gammaproteobacteria bacterium]|nr:hypothetical protein [Gammaproteobacteria bacterium]